MIVVDTNVLVYAAGAEHPLREPSRRLVEAIGDGRSRATTIAEVIQELVHVRAQRRSRRDAVDLGSNYAQLLSPLLVVGQDELRMALRLYGRHERLTSFDALLAATAITRGAEALVSADRAFAGIRGLRHVVPGTAAFELLVA